MSIYKRNDTWWIQITTANGERIQRSSGTQVKQEAQELHDKMKAEAWRVKNLGSKPRHTWQEAVVRWISEHGHKRSMDTDKLLLRWLNSHLNNKHIDEINKSLIDIIKQDKLKTGASNATVNRHMGLMKAILRCAKDDWEWLDTIPAVKLLPEPRIRLRWLTQDEANRLLSELPEHLKAMARFSLATGLRQSNVTGLQWSQLDMQRHCAWIHADQAKAEKAIAVPLGVDALEVLRAQFGKNDTYVFTYEGKPVTRANNHAWRKALIRAGIKDFRWHDLRHTWASWHVQNGTPLNILKELGGWADLTMVMRYAHLSSDHLKEFTENAQLKKREGVLVLKENTDAL
ncbi:tyrosine-type recombinase/integrase [Methylobacter psychrophilus]|uniref:tyrosine-type recombinase/integrase n=1 Tax=Methylobacter psychrophilus TaxID=96941 RepID=UPI0021D50F95|nr:site-specific integrase [Methylobacter psychrophilus]